MLTDVDFISDSVSNARDYFHLFGILFKYKMKFLSRWNYEIMN